MQILVVDDEPQITRVLRTSLQGNGHEVQVAQNGAAALELFLKRQPDLVITDLSMPGMDGIELTREIRARRHTWSCSPCATRTRRRSPRSMKAPTTTSPSRSAFRSCRRASACRCVVSEPPKQFDLMVYFLRNSERVLTHKTLLRAVWGAAGVDQPEYLRVLVAQLRKKIEPASEPVYILSEPWVGHRLNPSGEPQQKTRD